MVSLVGVSIAGAVTSNAMQMLIARFVIFGEVAWLIAPLFLVTGLVTGTVMGFFAEFFIEHSTWYSCAIGHTDELGLDLNDATPDERNEESSERNGSSTANKRASATTIASASSASATPSARVQKNTARYTRRERYESLFEPWVSALAGIIVAIIFLLQQGILIKLIFLTLFVAWAWLAGKRFSLVSTIVVSAGIVLANLLIPSGKVLFKLGPMAVTQFALTEGISKALTFEGLMYLSKAAIMPDLHFPGKFGVIIARAFKYYDRIIEYRGKVRAKTVVRDVDALMRRVWASAQPTSGFPGEKET